jgi:hypothetical protein
MMAAVGVGEYGAVERDPAGAGRKELWQVPKGWNRRPRCQLRRASADAKVDKVSLPFRS